MFGDTKRIVDVMYVARVIDHCALECSKRLVKDYMRKIKMTIRSNDHIMKAVYEMVEQNVSLLPVLDGDKVVGVVRSVDVLDEIRNVLNSENNHDT